MEANITVVNTASFVIQGKIDDIVWNIGQLAELKVATLSDHVIYISMCVIIIVNA